jgi:hypothetical protein
MEARSIRVYILSLVFSCAFFLTACGGGGSSSFTAESPVPNADPTAPSPGPSHAPSVVGPVAPQGATVIDQIEDRKGWGHCSDCAADPAKKHPPIAVWEFHQHQNTPSKDGSSLRMFVGGSAPYANALHWTKLGPHNKAKNFLWEFDIYASPESKNAQNLEFDLFQALGGKQFMFGTQCNYIKGIWQGWNAPQNRWIDLPQAPCKKFASGTWTHVKWLFQRTDDGKLHYVSVTVGGTTYKVDNYQSPKRIGWSDVVGVQFQQDLNSDGNDYAIWVDQVKVSMW